MACFQAEAERFLHSRTAMNFMNFRPENLHITKLGRCSRKGGLINTQYPSTNWLVGRVYIHVGGENSGGRKNGGANRIFKAAQ